MVQQQRHGRIETGSFAWKFKTLLTVEGTIESGDLPGTIDIRNAKQSFNALLAPYADEQVTVVLTFPGFNEYTFTGQVRMRQLPDGSKVYSMPALDSYLFIHIGRPLTISLSKLVPRGE